MAFRNGTDRRRLRIALHDYGCYPFTVQLARTLAARGHEVLYLFAAGLRNAEGPIEHRPDDPPTLTITGIPIDRRRRGSLAGRFLAERRYRIPLAARIAAFAPDVVISANTPLDAQAAILAEAKRIGATFVFWMQDVYSMAVGRLLRRGWSIPGRLLGARFARIERRLLRESDAVVAIASDFLPFMRRWQVEPDRVSVIPNWAPLDEVPPLDKANAWATEHGLADVPVFLYAGTLGFKHDPAKLLALARGIPGARMVVISEGRGADWLRMQVASTPNLVVLPFQPYERLPEVLASADVLVAILEPHAGTLSLPSKVLTYLAAGRPILASIAKDNPAAKMLTDIGAGSVVTPDDVGGFVAAAQALLDDPAVRVAAGQAGRDHAVAAFDIETIADRFESVLRRSRPSIE